MSSSIDKIKLLQHNHNNYLQNRKNLIKVREKEILFLSQTIHSNFSLSSHNNNNASKSNIYLKKSLRSQSYFPLSTNKTSFNNFYNNSNVKYPAVTISKGRSDTMLFQMIKTKNTSQENSRNNNNSNSINKNLSIESKNIFQTQPHFNREKHKNILYKNSKWKFPIETDNMPLSEYIEDSNKIKKKHQSNSPEINIQEINFDNAPPKRNKYFKFNFRKSKKLNALYSFSDSQIKQIQAAKRKDSNENLKTYQQGLLDAMEKSLPKHVYANLFIKFHKIQRKAELKLPYNVEFIKKIEDEEVKILNNINETGKTMEKFWNAESNKPEMHFAEIKIRRIFKIPKKKARYFRPFKGKND